MGRNAKAEQRTDYSGQREQLPMVAWLFPPFAETVDLPSIGGRGVIPPPVSVGGLFIFPPPWLRQGIPAERSVRERERVMPRFQRVTP